MMSAICCALLATVTIGPGPDVSAAFCTAIERAKRLGGETIVLERGEYHFPVGTAQKMEFFISNHDQSPFHLVNLPIAGVTNLTVRGNGATLVFHGATIGAAVVGSANVRLEKLRMDWSRPFVTEMKVAGFEGGKTIGTIDERIFPYDLEDGKIIAKGEGWRTSIERCMAFRGDTHEIVERTCDIGFCGKAMRGADGRLVCDYDFSKVGAGLRPGDVVALRPSLRPRPACVIHRSADTVFEDVAIHTAWGMGVICQMSENFAWRGTGEADDMTSGVFPPAGSGRVTTLHADASHFSNVKGTVIVENCLFETMMDDAINVHSTCLGIVKVEGKRRIRCRYMHEQAVGFGVFEPGDRLRFIAGKTLENGNVLRVAAVETHDAREISLTLAEDLPPGYGVGDAVENADYQPAVVFRGNTVRNNRARGALFTTPGRVVVESNLFDHVSGAAILFAGDAQGWHESGACEDVLVADNVFRDCLTSRYQFCDGIISSWPMVRELQNQKRHYHRNIRIERNVFETFDAPILFALSTDDLVFADDNVIRRNAHYQAWRDPPFTLKACDRAALPKFGVSNPLAGRVVGRGGCPPDGYVPPLVSNGDLNMLVEWTGGQSDANYFGMMPTVYWQGRRGPAREAELFGFGKFMSTMTVDGNDAGLPDEWAQTLDTTQAVVVCEGDFAGGIESRIEVFCALDRNVVGVRRAVKNVGDAVRQVVLDLDYRMSSHDRLAGAWQNTDVERKYCGRTYGHRVIDFDIRITASDRGNVRRTVSLKPGEAMTADWFVTFSDSYEKARTGVSMCGWNALFAAHVQAWKDYYDESFVKLPDARLQRMYDVQQYHLRCMVTRWGFPVGIFPSHWQGKYFGFDEVCMHDGLISAGHFDVARRSPEWRQAVIPWALQRQSHYNRPGKFGARWMWMSLEDGERVYIGRCTDLERLGPSRDKAFLTTCSAICALRAAAAASELLKTNMVSVPDFTRGNWRNVKPWGVVSVDLKKMGLDKDDVTKGTAAMEV